MRGGTPPELLDFYDAMSIAAAAYELDNLDYQEWMRTQDSSPKRSGRRHTQKGQEIAQQIIDKIKNRLNRDNKLKEIKEELNKILVNFIDQQMPLPEMDTMEYDENDDTAQSTAAAAEMEEDEEKKIRILELKVIIDKLNQKIKKIETLKNNPAAKKGEKSNAERLLIQTREKIDKLIDELKLLEPDNFQNIISEPSASMEAHPAPPKKSSYFWRAASSAARSSADYLSGKTKKEKQEKRSTGDAALVEGLQ